MRRLRSRLCPLGGGGLWGSPHAPRFRGSRHPLSDREAEVDDIAMMRLLAREGAGVAVLPPIAVRDELEAGILSLGPEISGLTESFYAITLRRRFPNPLLREVLSRPTEGDPV